MKRIEGTERADWRAKAEAAGFTFHEMHGAPYWDETHAYAFSLEEIEAGIEDPCTELHGMCREAAARIASDESLMERLCIPEAHRDLVAGSWAAGEPELYGRMDLSWGGTGPAKLLEYNADTPTALYEAADFQWSWLEEARAAGLIAEGADQFNRIFEALAERLAAIFEPGADLHFAAQEGSAEDYATVETLAYAAREAGLGAHYTDLERIGITTAGQLADGEGRVIGALFKLYPWEDMLRDPFAEAIGPSGCRILEPAWKALVSNKGILPVLWEMFEGHPNLLPAFFEADWTAGAEAALRAEARGLLAAGTASKPIFSREGAGVRLMGPAGEAIAASEDAAYDAHPRVVQALAPLPEVAGMRPVLGAWIVGEACVGLGIREDASPITGDMSRFVPHLIAP